jgi:hypothetical protein
VRRNLLGHGAGELRLQAGGRSEMVEQVGVGLADFRRHRLQRHRLRPLFDQQAARGIERGGAAFLRAEALTDY